MDIQYLLWLQAFRNATHDIFNTFFLFITKFGETPYYIILVILFFYAIDKNLGSFMLLGHATTTFVYGIIKLTACVYRPWIKDARIIPPGDAKATATGYSFPSGHSSKATAIFGSAAWSYRKRKGLCAAFAVFLALILFSRNYIGVHTPQDVIVAFLETVAVLALLQIVLPWVEKGGNRDIIITASVIVLSILALVYFLFKSYPMDYDAAGKLLVNPKSMQGDSFTNVGIFAGTFVGWLLERRCIRFSTNVDEQTKFLRCISGLLAFYAVSYIVNSILLLVLPTMAARFLGSFLTWLYVMAIHPMIFCAVEKKYPAKESQS